MPVLSENPAQDTFIDGRLNPYVREVQAAFVIQPQFNRLEYYAQVVTLLDCHIEKSEGQILRLNQIPESIGTSALSLIGLSLSSSGTMAAIGHTVASNEILQNSPDNVAFEDFEIVAYTSWTASEETGGISSTVPMLRQNLNEQATLAAGQLDSLLGVTQHSIDLHDSGERANFNNYQMKECRNG